MVALRQAITVPLALVSFVAVFYSIGKLVLFLSLPSKIPIQYIWLVNVLDNWSRLETSLHPITINAALIILFVLQHSLFKTELVKGIWRKLGLETAERSIYNLATAGILVFLIENWHPTPNFVLWNVDVESHKSIWWAFVVTHAIAWIVIYGGSVIMDLPELLGIKQVYYDINGLLSPLSYKSNELKRFYSHVRHPSFFGFTIILWVTNLMSIDRLLLALLWTTYMFVAWRTDKQDLAYHRGQYDRKKAELHIK